MTGHTKWQWVEGIFSVCRLKSHDFLSYTHVILRSAVADGAPNSVPWLYFKIFDFYWRFFSILGTRRLSLDCQRAEIINRFFLAKIEKIKFSLVIPKSIDLKNKNWLKRVQIFGYLRLDTFPCRKATLNGALSGWKSNDSRIEWVRLLDASIIRVSTQFTAGL